MVVKPFDHRAGHAQVQPDTLPAGNGVLMYCGVNDTRSGIDGGQTAPEFLALFRQSLIGSALVSKIRTATIFRRSDYVVPGVGEGVRVEAAIVVPLGANPGNPVTTVV